MEEKRLKQFTFYDLYYEALKGLPDEVAGRMAKNICRFMFTNEEVPEPQDDRENFFWSNIKDVLEEVIDKPNEEKKMVWEFPIEFQEAKSYRTEVNSLLRPTQWQDLLVRVYV